MLCYAMLCYAMLCYAMLYYTILYYTILYYTIVLCNIIYRVAGAPAARELSRKVLGGAEQRVAVVPRDAARRHEKVHVPRKPGVSRLRPPPSAAHTGARGGGGAGAAPRGGCRAAASDPRGRCCP